MKFCRTLCLKKLFKKFRTSGIFSINFKERWKMLKIVVSTTIILEKLREHFHECLRKITIYSKKFYWKFNFEKFSKKILRIGNVLGNIFGEMLHKHRGNR